MNILVAGVSSELQYVEGLISFHRLRIGSHDEVAVHKGATGLAARKALCTEFLMNKEFDALMMLDLDMSYPEDTLTRLRNHDLDMVTGHYYRRQLDPMMSITETSPDGSWPFSPVVDIPHSGLHEVAVAGFGCVLIKREVIEAVAETLPPLSHPFDNGPLEWLTGSALVLGPDKRFFPIARKLGYKLMMDAEVRCRHAVTAWLDDDLYEKLRNRLSQARVLAGYWLDNLRRYGVEEKTIKLRLQSLSLERDALVREFNEEKDDKTLEELQPTVLKLNEYDNRMAECKDWITGLQATVKWPAAHPDMLDKFEESRVATGDEQDAGHARKSVTRRAASSWVDVLDAR